jgi:hypothetical protein
VLSVRKVVVYELLSLDGVADKPEAWFAGWDDVTEANLGAVIAAQDAVILGRRSYEEWAGFWPGSDIEPFATFINGVAKYVATSAPLDRGWANATAIDGDLAGFVRDLRSQPGADIGVHADGLPAIRLEPIRSTATPAGHLLADYRVIGYASSPPRQPGSATQVATGTATSDGHAW